MSQSLYEPNSEVTWKDSWLIRNCLSERTIHSKNNPVICSLDPSKLGKCMQCSHSKMPRIPAACCFSILTGTFTANTIYCKTSDTILQTLANYQDIYAEAGQFQDYLVWHSRASSETRPPCSCAGEWLPLSSPFKAHRSGA